MANGRESTICVSNLASLGGHRENRDSDSSNSHASPSFKVSIPSTPCLPHHVVYDVLLGLEILFFAWITMKISSPFKGEYHEVSTVILRRHYSSLNTSCSVSAPHTVFSKQYGFLILCHLTMVSAGPEPGGFYSTNPISNDANTRLNL